MYTYIRIDKFIEKHTYIQPKTSWQVHTFTITNIYTQTNVPAYTHTNISLNLSTVIFTYKKYTVSYILSLLYKRIHFIL